MNDRQILEDALKFHGHKCWASTAGVRIGQAALEALGADRSGAKSLHAVLEIGDYHGAMCFGDGVQHTTGCTFGKGNIEKNPKGKLGVTLIDKANNKAVRVAYKPALQKQIKESAFMQKRAAGIPPTQIPEDEQWELVNLIWDAPAGDIMTVGHFDWQLMVYAAVAVIVGSQVGAHVMQARMRPLRLKQMFGVVLLVVAGKLIMGLV
ncbi:MAG: FmdE family protein [Anaerolineae bacterium]